MRLYVLDANGEPQLEPDVIAWARWFAQSAATREHVIAEDRDEAIAADHPGAVRVSTVFLGVDHNYHCGIGPPLLWETMVFGGAHDGSQERYPSRAAALAGHQRWCREVAAR